MSASSNPVRAPDCAKATARLTLTVDFPTPPLPEATAMLCWIPVIGVPEGWDTSCSDDAAKRGRRPVRGRDGPPHAGANLLIPGQCEGVKGRSRANGRNPG